MVHQARVLQVAIPVFNGVTPLDAIGAYESLHALPNVEIVFVAHQAGSYTDSLGQATLVATACFDEIQCPDIVILPGGFGARFLISDREFLDWLVEAHKSSLYTASVSTGSLLLAAAGLLNGLRATTHWDEFDTLQSLGAKPVKAPIVEEGKILTAAGASAGIELGLRLVELLSDKVTAEALQVRMEYNPQPPFDISTSGSEILYASRALSYNLEIQGVKKALAECHQNVW